MALNTPHAKAILKLTLMLGSFFSFILSYFLTPVLFAQPAWVANITSFMFLGAGIGTVGFIALTLFVFSVAYCCSSIFENSRGNSTVSPDRMPNQDSAEDDENASLVVASPSQGGLAPVHMKNYSSDNTHVDLSNTSEDMSKGNRHAQNGRDLSHTVGNNHYQR